MTKGGYKIVDREWKRWKLVCTEEDLIKLYQNVEVLGEYNK